ncbi:MAG: hypothetical protein M1823_004559 [Watsoniomyces obsoletus]|nr:MAG: hypothetical protein M1823_004559 [Watsoniomyces obsoletus]
MSLDLRLSGAETAGRPGTGAPSRPGLNIDLASNNPFRNRAATPQATPTNFSPSNPFFPSNTTTTNGSRPVSRNPFLDSASVSAMNATDARPAPQSPPLAAPYSPSADFVVNDLNKLSIHGDARAHGHDSRQSSVTDGRTMAHAGRADNGNILLVDLDGGQDRALPPGHRITRSQEEERRPPHREGSMPAISAVARPPRTSRGPEGASFAARTAGPRALRRNSESSLFEGRSGGGSGDPTPEDRKQRERRHREHRNPDGSARPSKSKRAQRLDVIDKLDVTSIYGTGLFHHDGPFDACNPHRNRKNSKRAPMQAFAKDSANNMIGGSGPVNRDIDRAQFLGDRGAEAFSDFSKSGEEPYGARNPRPAVDRSQSFDPVSRVDPVHGDESLGLGTSTFLEGAPASRTAIQRRESESEGKLGGAGDMTRKKSLVKKIRSLNPSRQYGSVRTGSVDLKYDDGPFSPRETQGPLTPPVRGGTGDQTAEPNPFFSSDYDAAYDQKGERIAVAESKVSGTGLERVPTSPRRGLERSSTHDTTAAARVESEPKPSLGFMSRVRSLRGGRRPRTSERPA